MSLIRARRLDASPVDEIIEGIIPDVSVGVMYGPSGTGKSLVLLAMQMAVTNDLPFMGRDVMPGSAVYCLGEGLQDAGIRIKALQYAALTDGVQLSDGRIFYETKTFSLAVETDRQQAIERWSVIPDLQLVVFDVLRQFAGNRSTAHGTSAAILVNGAKEIAKALGCTVILVVHTTKDESSFAGSQELFNLSDFFIKVANGAITVEKQKTGPRIPPVPYVIRRLSWTDPTTGRLVRSAFIAQPPKAELFSDDDDGLVPFQEVAKVAFATACERHGLTGSMTRLAIERGIPLSELGLAPPEKNEGDEADDDELSAAELFSRLGLPEISFDDGMQLANGRKPKRTGLLPDPPGKSVFS